MVDDEALFEQVRSRLVAAVRPRKIVVFGSRARGDARADSDLDLMVVADVRGSLAERSGAVGAPLLDIDVPIDLVIYTPEEYERFRKWRSSVAGIADHEGRVLHG